MSVLRAGKFFARRSIRPAKKFFRAHKSTGTATLLTFPGVVGAVVTHPFEHAQVGRQGLPKYVKFTDADGKVIKQKNPARFAKLKYPGIKPITYDSGDYWQHLAARIPKGVITSAAIFGSRKAIGKFWGPK